jgi:antitoxin ParD1/3/4
MNSSIENHLAEEREARSQALKETLNASIAEGGAFTDDDIADAINAKVEELAKAGPPFRPIRT